MDIKKNLLDALNVTIGTFKLLETEIDKKKEEFKENLEKLAQKGSEDDSEVSEKSRQLIEKFVDDTQVIVDGLERAGADFKEKVSEVMDKLPINFNKTSDETHTYDDAEQTKETNSESDTDSDLNKDSSSKENS